MLERAGRALRLNGSRLGTHLRSPVRAWLAFAAAAAALAWDRLYNVYPYEQASLHRLLAALCVGVVLVALGGFDRPGLGLRLRPVQGWRYWIGATVIAGLVVGVLCALALGVLWIAELEMPGVVVWEIDWLDELWIGEVVAPITEEALFRFALCVPVAAVAGPWAAVLIPGLVFASVHLGNAAPSNMMGGFVFSWAYVKSESLAVPIALHALGNLCVAIGMSIASALGS